MAPQESSIGTKNNLARARQDGVLNRRPGICASGFNEKITSQILHFETIGAKNPNRELQAFGVIFCHRKRMTADQNEIFVNPILRREIFNCFTNLSMDQNDSLVRGLLI